MIVFFILGWVFTLHTGAFAQVEQSSGQIPLLEKFGIAKADICGYWDFTVLDGSAATDLSGHGNAINALDIRMIAGRPASLSLGARNSVEIADHEGLWGHDQFTINFWLKMRREPDNPVCIISKCVIQPCEFRLQIADCRSDRRRTSPSRRRNSDGMSVVPANGFSRGWTLPR
jgi:hypothetical protein